MLKNIAALFAPTALQSFALEKERQKQRQRLSTNSDDNKKKAVTREEQRGSHHAQSKSFWGCKADVVAVQDLKRTYANDRFVDKKTRFVVRQRLREEGVTSNLFPLQISSGSTVYVYEIEATRVLVNAQPRGEEPERTSGGENNCGKQKTRKKKKNWDNGATELPTALSKREPIVKRVEATRAWRVVRRFLRRSFPAAPPVINVRQKVYATSPLPVDALQLPAEYFDLGWNACKLQFAGKVVMTQLEPAELQEITNKIILWALGSQENSNERFFVGKECNGKVVCTHNCFIAGGLRIFKGSVVRAVFIDASSVDKKALASDVTNAFSFPPSSAVLTTLPEGHHVAKPLRFLVKEFLREFVFKETPVQSYRIEDASGVIMASMWKATKTSLLKPGVLYEVTNYRVRVFENRGGMRLLEMTVGETAVKPLEGTVDGDGDGDDDDDGGNTPTKTTTGATATESPKKRKQKGKQSLENEDAGSQTAAKNIIKPEVATGSLPLSTMPGVLALKIDTKSTVAAELSLWEEVKQHFGSGPYDKATEERVLQSLQGMPVVVSVTLRHSMIRLVRFNILSAETNLDPALQRFLCDIEPGQPHAVLVDYSVLPLQALHCCYDPRMKSWQDICVSACSFLPARRVDILQMFQAVLESRVRQWGLVLAPQPYFSKALSLLPAPQKVTSAAVREARQKEQRLSASSPQLRHPPPPSFPTTIAVVGIAAAHLEEEERLRVTRTAQALANYYRSGTIITVPDEKDAVQFLVQQLAKSAHGPASDPNTAAVFLTAERDTRPARWVRAECLTRGILPLFMPPAASPKRHNLLCENVRMRLRVNFETDPARGVNVAKEVPAVALRRVLLVGVDACHTTTVSTGSVVGVLCAPERNHLLPLFWKQETRGMEAELVVEHFRFLLDRASSLYDGLDEVVVFQDGDVYSEVQRMQANVPEKCGFTYLCLHKRTNIRFVHQIQEDKSNLKVKAGNVVKGAVVQALTPISLFDDVATTSFYLQNHDCNMSTARTVHYTVHSKSPTLDVSDVQQLSYVFSHVLATQSTKLPMPTRCAHRLASVAERLLDAVPPLTFDMIPAPLNERLWFF